ncbi:hypothetical protein CRYUN_Cryun07bG0148000 [Craigia yunnanensis]
MLVERRYQCKEVLLLAYQSFGVLFGDLSISPLYVYKSTFSGKLSNYQSEDVIFGALSLFFWTFTLLSLFKHVIILLNADDNGEGKAWLFDQLLNVMNEEIFLCTHSFVGMQNFLCFPIIKRQMKSFLHITVRDTQTEICSHHQSKSLPRGIKSLKTALLLLVLFSTCLVICVGFLTPAISIRSSIEGLKVRSNNLHYGVVVVIACILLVGLFVLQHCGTYRVAFMFAPIVILWTFSIAAIDLGFNRSSIDLYTGFLDSCMPFLSTTGTEAMFADLGQYTAASIRLSFYCIIYPCLVLQYMGQAAFLSKNFAAVSTSFYASIPDKLLDSSSSIISTLLNQGYQFFYLTYV